MIPWLKLPPVDVSELFFPALQTITKYFSNYKDVDVLYNHPRMHSACCLAKNLLVRSTFLWVLCECRHLLGIGTRLVVSSDGNLVHAYPADLRTDAGYSDSVFHNLRIPYEVWIVIIIVLFLLTVLIIYICLACQMRSRRRLWSNIVANPQQPVPPTSSPVLQENVRTSGGYGDAPPDYTEVVEQKTMAADASDSSNHFPKVVGEKKLETPPPAYLTVAPFK